MIFPDSELARARPPRLLAAGFGPDTAGTSDVCAQVIARMVAQTWAPAGARLETVTAPASWTRGPQAVEAAMAATASDAILLVFAAPRASAFQVLMRAQNRAARRRPDIDGEIWSAPRIAPTGPGVARVTAPVPDLVAAIKALGLAVVASSEVDDHVGNLTLYRLLTALDPEGTARPIGALAVPAAASLDEAERATKAACAALAQRLIARRETPASA